MLEFILYMEFTKLHDTLSYVAATGCLSLNIYEKINLCGSKFVKDLFIMHS